MGDSYVYITMNANLPSSQRQHSPRSAHALGHTIQLAALVTAAAAVLAWVLASIARLPENAVVISVMTVAFLASWAVTNHRPARTHRVTVVRARVQSH